jgi:hypothetical protein
MMGKTLQTALAVLFFAATALLAKPPPAHAGASSVYGVPSCTSTGLELRLYWQNDGVRLLQQYVDVAAADTGWLPGSFVSYGPWDGSASSVVIPGLRPGRVFFRINQQRAGGTWESTATYYLQLSPCASLPVSKPPAKPSARSVSELDWFVLRATAGAYAAGYPAPLVAAYPYVPPSNYVVEECVTNCALYFAAPTPPVPPVPNTPNEPPPEPPPEPEE